MRRDAHVRPPQIAYTGYGLWGNRSIGFGLDRQLSMATAAHLEALILSSQPAFNPDPSAKHPHHTGVLLFCYGKILVFWSHDVCVLESSYKYLFEMSK